jgi:hypothetical protein
MSRVRRSRPPRHRLMTALAAGAAGAFIVLGPVQAGAATPSSPPPAPPVTVVDYDSQSPQAYAAHWANIYGPLDGVVPQVSPSGAVTLTDVPFKPGTDFSVFDHLKYIGVSTQAFAVPKVGAVTFEVDIAASTPGAVAGHVVHGVYGPPGAWSAADPLAKPYSATVLQGQQAGVVLNMIDFCTGQLFDWFVSGSSAFPLIERLPTAVTGNTSNAACPGATDVGLDKAYTQIIKSVSVAPGRPHHVAITFSHSPGQAAVSYALDGTVVATVTNVGIPLDRQGNRLSWSGTYTSLGTGEKLADQISSFSIGHGLFSLLDAFPFQYGCTPPPVTSGVGSCPPESAGYSVSLSPSERSFGQGAQGVFSGFRVTTTGR